MKVFGILFRHLLECRLGEAEDAAVFRNCEAVLDSQMAKMLLNGATMKFQCLQRRAV